MGWSFKWLSSGASDCNFDYDVSFTPEEAHTRTAFYNYARTDPGTLDREVTCLIALCRRKPTSVLKNAYIDEF